MLQQNKMTMGDYLNYLFLVIVILVMAYPFLFVVSISISDPAAVARKEVWLFPKGFSLTAYSGLIKTNAILQAYRNSIVYSVLGTLCTLVVGMLAAYPLSEVRFRPRTIIAMVLASTIFLHPGLIPLFLVYNSYGLTNTIWS